MKTVLKCPEPEFILWWNNLDMSSLPVFNAHQRTLYSLSVNFSNGATVSPMDNFTCQVLFAKQTFAKQLSPGDLNFSTPLLGAIDLKVSNVQSKSFKIEWNNSEYGALVDYYSVKVVQKLSGVTKKFKTAKLKKKIAKLLPFTDYTVRVLSYTKNGRRQSSNAVAVRTLADKPISPVKNLTAFLAINNDIQISWKVRAITVQLHQRK